MKELFEFSIIYGPCFVFGSLAVILVLKMWLDESEESKAVKNAFKINMFFNGENTKKYITWTHKETQRMTRK